MFVWMFLGAFSSQAQMLSEKQTEKRALEILKEYDSQAYGIVTKANNLKTSYNFAFCGRKITTFSSGSILGYIDERTEEGIIKDLPTVVHELTHGYVGHPHDYLLENKICPEKKYQIYPFENKEVLLALTPTFASRELAKVIPKDKITFRYETYITGTSSTQSQGVYGLLDEWHAYYVGARTSFLLKEYYQKTVQKPHDWINFFSHINSELVAYYEFRYFILTYLQHAKQNNPAIFKAIIQNAEFKKVFKYVDDSYAKLISDFKAFRNQLQADLQKKGVKALKREDNFYIENRGTPWFETQEDIVKLEPELNKKEFQEILTLLKP